MSTNRSIVLALLLLVVAPTSGVGQGRSPLLDKIARSVTGANSSWHILPGVCTCAALASSQTAYAFGYMYHRRISDHRHVIIYIGYVPTNALAADWLGDLRDRKAVNGWRGDEYKFADEAYLFWTSDAGGASLYFRRGEAIGWISGPRTDVEFFAHTLLNQWAR